MTVATSVALDMRIVYKGSHKNISLVLLFFLVWMDCQHHELEVDCSAHVVYSLHTHNYILSSTYQMTLNN